MVVNHLRCRFHREGHIQEPQPFQGFAIVSETVVPPLKCGTDSHLRPRGSLLGHDYDGVFFGIIEAAGDRRLMAL